MQFEAGPKPKSGILDIAAYVPGKAGPKQGKVFKLSSNEQPLGASPKAVAAYQQVLKTDSGNLDAKTGMGVCYVSGSSNPMQGITLLLGVVSKDPGNVNANFNLGLFSMRSGQYDKAIGRFQNVVKTAPDGEAYFYLAQAFQNLNRKKEAVEAYRNARKYIHDAETVSSIDHLIQQLN